MVMGEYLPSGFFPDWNDFLFTGPKSRTTEVPGSTLCYSYCEGNRFYKCSDLKPGNKPNFFFSSPEMRNTKTEGNRLTRSHLF